jgi:hypothetical protein
MIGNESLAASLDENAAGELLSWGKTIAERVVNATDGMDDASADEHIALRMRALRLMMRAIGRWVGEAESLDEETRLALWMRAGDQAQVLFGESFVFPSMNEALAQIPSDANAAQVIAWLKTFIEEKGSKE